MGKWGKEKKSKPKPKPAAFFNRFKKKYRFQRTIIFNQRF